MLDDIQAVVVVRGRVAGAAVHGPEEAGRDGGEALVGDGHVALANAQRLHQQLRRMVQVLQRHLPTQKKTLSARQNSLSAL